MLDARQGYWQDRKREWLSLGIASEVGRDADLTFQASDTEVGNRIRAAGSTTSVFDPVLCELAYRWFCPPGGLVLDPFAGGSVRGIVASRLGRQYLGIELRPEQVEANREQAARICREDDPQPEWITGDTAQLLDLVPADTQADMLFSCPPYGDLEKYSDDDRDLSAMSHEAFITAYRDIITNACSLLRDNRFVVWVTGDFRDPRGNLRLFPADTATAFADAGLHLLNDAILVTACGSLPLRVGRQFEAGRKLGRTHQNVQAFTKGSLKAFAQDWQLAPHHESVSIFAKGDSKKATAAVGKVQTGDPTDISDLAPEEAAA